MRKFCIILFAILSLLLLLGLVWPFETRLSDRDMERITALIREQTDEPILSVRPLTRWRAHVETGTKPAPLSGGGHAYHLRWGFGGWRIYQSSLWIG